VVTAPYENQLDGFARGENFWCSDGARAVCRDGSPIPTLGSARGARTIKRMGPHWSDLDQRHAVNLYLSFRISDRTNISTKIRGGTNIPAPSYYACSRGTTSSCRPRGTR
jgi:hypothetical protein